jgi:hypothetical protein
MNARGQEASDFLAAHLPVDELSVIYVRDKGTVCRSCLKRNAPGTPVVTIATNVGRKPAIGTSLCFDCYKIVQEFLENKLDLPKLSTLKLRDRYAEGVLFCKPKHTLAYAVNMLRNAVKACSTESNLGPCEGRDKAYH